MPKKNESSDDDVLVFIYRDAKGRIDIQEVYSASEDDTYIQGYKVDDGGIRTYRKDRVLEVVTPETQVAQRVAFYQDTLPPPTLPLTPTSGVTRHVVSHRDGVPEVCFTGFKAQDKVELIRLAEDWGMVVRSVVASHLDFLCYGYNAGPMKMERARQQGVTILSEYQFRVMLEAGEVPESSSPE